MPRNTAANQEKKARKAYPDRETRIAMADAKIERLEKLNAERRALIEKTETKLNARKSALAKSEAELAKIKTRRGKLENAQNRPARTGASRSIKASEKAQFDQLKALLESKGQTMEDLLKNL